MIAGRTERAEPSRDRRGGGGEGAREATPPVPERATGPNVPVSFAKAFGWGATSEAPSPLGRPVAARDSAAERAADAAERSQRGAASPADARLHTDARADGYARALNADAVTLGSDVFIARAAWNLGTAATHALLAHELHHVRHGEPGVVYRKPAVDGQQAEFERAALGAAQILESVPGSGAIVAFEYFLAAGTITLSSWHRLDSGDATGRSASARDAQAAMVRQLSSAAASNFGTLRLTFRLTGDTWSSEPDYVATPLAEGQLPPPEARNTVDAATAFTGAQNEALRALLDQEGPVLSIPRGSSAKVVLSVTFVGDHAKRIDLVTKDYGGRADLAPPSELSLSRLMRSLIAFSPGYGRRVVRLELDGRADTGSGEAEWSVRDASLPRERPPEEPSANEQYHADIEQWEEQADADLKDAGWAAAGMVLDEAVLNVVTEGLFNTVGAVAPTVLRVLAGSHGAGVRWLESLGPRLSLETRRALRTLLTKVSREGVEALSTGERRELRAALEEVERVVNSKITRDEAEKMRDIARGRFWEAHPALEASLRRPNGSRFPIHHKFPLEYAHLNPLLDVNGAGNLVALDQSAHDAVSATWSLFRKGVKGSQPSLSQITRVVDAINARFGRWYDAPVLAGDAAAVQAARDAVAVDVARILRSP